MKKIIIISLALIVLAGSGWLLWHNFINSSEAVSEIEQNNAENNQGVKIEYISTTAVISPVLAYDELSIWYFDSEGRELLRQHLQDKSDIKRFPLPAHQSVKFALWPDQGSDFILVTDSGRFLYDSQSQRFIPYPDEVKYVDWMPIIQRVAYIWSDNTGTSFSVARPNVTGHRVIAHLPHANFRFSISPNGRSFLFYTPEESSPLYLVIDGIGVPEPLSGNQRVYAAKFSPDGKFVALITDRDGLVQLGVFNLATREYRALGEILVGRDFVWSNDGQSIYWSGLDGELWRSNLTNNERQNLLTNIASGAGIVAKQLLLSKDESVIYFVESPTNRLGRINLK